MITTPGTGHVWLVGGGPGDPGLLTLAGQRALAEADVVVYDALVPTAELQHCRPDAELVFAGKRSGAHAMTQSQIEALLVDHALTGKRVARLKGGDPFVFGRGGEEALACRAAGIPFTVVPGVSSAIAASAYAGIPVTHRGLSSSFTVVTGTDIDAIDDAPKSGTIVVLMGAESLGALLGRIEAAGRNPDTPAAFIQWGTRPDQRVIVASLSTLASRVIEAGTSAPAVTVVGDVASLAEQLDWWRPGPLAGRTVAVVRALGQTSELSRRLCELGAQVVEAPVLTIRYCTGDLVTDERVSLRWDWIVFTSANAVGAFFTALESAGRDARALGTMRIAAIGGGTSAALRVHGILADFVPSKSTAACLSSEMPGVSGARILLPMSSLADSTMEDALHRRGGLIESVVVYETLARPLTAEQARDVCAADAIAFTSASTARFLAQALTDQSMGPPKSRDRVSKAQLLSIGPRTSAAIRESFAREPIEAVEPSLDALISLAQKELAWD